MRRCEQQAGGPFRAKILMLPGGFTSPYARFRMWELVGALQARGYSVTARATYPDRVGKNRAGEATWLARISPKLAAGVRAASALAMLRDVRKFDLVFANRDIVPEVSVRAPERRIFDSRVPLVFDFDDAIHLGRRERKIAWILSRAAWSTPGNEFLAGFARRHCSHVTVVPAVVNTDVYRPAAERTPGPLRIGWSGSASTNRRCLPLLREPIRELARVVDMEFIIISNEDPGLKWPGVRIRYIRWVAEREVEDLRLIDIGTMPLEDREFERGKCGLKAIQYMALGIPAVVSPVGVNSHIVEHGRNGFLAASHEDWVRHLRTLAEDQALRSRFGREARATVERRFSHEVAADTLAACFDTILAGAGARAAG